MELGTFFAALLCNPRYTCSLYSHLLQICHLLRLPLQIYQPSSHPLQIYQPPVPNLPPTQKPAPDLPPLQIYHPFSHPLQIFKPFGVHPPSSDFPVVHTKNLANRWKKLVVLDFGQKKPVFQRSAYYRGLTIVIIHIVHTRNQYDAPLMLIPRSTNTAEGKWRMALKIQLYDAMFQSNPGDVHRLSTGGAVSYRCQTYETTS